MKLALLVCLVAFGSVRAEDVTVETSKTAAEANRAEQRRLDAERRAKKLLEERTVTYSGFFWEVSKAEKKSRLLSLRQPLDPKNDYKYVHLDERTGRPKGFTLFSLDF